MKLETSIRLRLDGTVVVAGVDGAKYTFIPDAASGLVVADVTDAATIGLLLRTGNFFPVDESDHDKASELMVEVGAGQTASDADAADEDLEDDPVDLNALPIEGTAPAAPRRTKKSAAVTE